MAMNEPMNDGRLARLRDEVDALADNDPQANMRITRHVRQMRELLAEIAYLRAREQALAAENESLADRLELLRSALSQEEAENAAMRPIVEAVAEHIGGYVSEHFRQCAFCGNGAIESRIIAHANGCEVEQARAFVAAHPATDTAAGEAESEGE